MNIQQFNSDEPLAYFITWTSYGTWLPGDERGWHAKDTLDVQPPNSLRQETASAKMKEPAFLLSKADRQVVEETILEHCKIRTWQLQGVNARTNHVHVVVTAPGCGPESVRDQLKAWCTRKLKKIIQNENDSGLKEQVVVGLIVKKIWKPR